MFPNQPINQNLGTADELIADFWVVSATVFGSSVAGASHWLSAQHWSIYGDNRESNTHVYKPIQCHIMTHIVCPCHVHGH